MLTPRLASCSISPLSLLGEIECFLFKKAKALYGNITLMLGIPVDGLSLMSLCHYRRILTYRQCNASYGGSFTLEQIAGRVKLLTKK